MLERLSPCVTFDIAKKQNIKYMFYFKRIYLEKIHYARYNESRIMSMENSDLSHSDEKIIL